MLGDLKRQAVVVSILVSRYANSANDAIPGRIHSGDFPKRSHAQNEKQPAISPTDASAYTIALFIDSHRRRR